MHPLYHVYIGVSPVRLDERRTYFLLGLYKVQSGITLFVLAVIDLFFDHLQLDRTISSCLRLQYHLLLILSLFTFIKMNLSDKTDFAFDKTEITTYFGFDDLAFTVIRLF